jgi:hypothetical protein
VAKKFAVLIAVSVLWGTSAPEFGLDEKINVEYARLFTGTYAGNLTGKQPLSARLPERATE